MDISKFAKKPELKKIEITNTDIIEQYGPVFFYVYDNVDYLIVFPYHLDIALQLYRQQL
jgi:hypothetical protein